MIAEVFYKFHSFTLECAAFLATWAALDAVAWHVRAALGGGRTVAAGDERRR